MLERSDRPELDGTVIFDHIVAPIYFQVLFGLGAISHDYLASLVDHLTMRPKATQPAGR